VPLPPARLQSFAKPLGPGNSTSVTAAVPVVSEDPGIVTIVGMRDAILVSLVAVLLSRRKGLFLCCQLIQSDEFSVCWLVVNVCVPVVSEDPGWSLLCACATLSWCGLICGHCCGHA